MRVVLAQGALLVLVMGVLLFVLAEDSEAHFAWVMGEPLTSAFLGANYCAVSVMGLAAARQHTWAHARIAALCSLVFTALTLGTSLQGMTYFYLDRPITWVWYGVYALVPVWMAVAWRAQVRDQAGAVDPVRSVPLPAWVRGVLGVQSSVLALGALALFVAGMGTPDWCPWNLTGISITSDELYHPVAGMPAPMETYVGVWLSSLAIGTAHATWENDLVRIRPLLLALLVLPVFHAVALVRYADVVRWEQPSCWAWLALLAGFGLVGAWGAVKVRPHAGLWARL